MKITSITLLLINLLNLITVLQFLVVSNKYQARQNSYYPLYLELNPAFCLLVSALFLYFQKYTCHCCDVLPGKLDMGGFHCAGTNCKTQHKFSSQMTWNKMNLPGIIYVFKKHFIKFIAALE